MIDWNEIQILEDGGLTFWKRKKDNSWSRDIKDLINNIQELEAQTNIKEKHNIQQDKETYIKANSVTGFGSCKDTLSLYLLSNPVDSCSPSKDKESK